MGMASFIRRVLPIVVLLVCSLLSLAGGIVIGHGWGYADALRENRPQGNVVKP
jgi:hypothetical protein